MKKEDLFEAIEKVDDELIKRSELKTKSKVFPKVMRLGIAAACLGVLVFLAIDIGIKNKESNVNMVNEKYSQEGISATEELEESASSKQVAEGERNTETIDITATEDVAYGFIMKDRIYFPIMFEERKEFGLVAKEDQGLTAENTYIPEKKDLGEKIGEVESTENKELVGASVYHYNSFPENEKIVIVESNGEYSFYIFSNMNSPLEKSMDSNAILNSYGMTLDSIKSIQVLDNDNDLITTIKDAKQINTIIKVISDKKDIGLSAHEQLYSDKWYEAYGSSEVYYDGEIMHYGINDEEHAKLYNKAHDLWNSNSCILEITTDKGLGLFAYYNPTIKTLSILNSFYQLSDAELENINAMINPE